MEPSRPAGSDEAARKSGCGERGGGEGAGEEGARPSALRGRWSWWWLYLRPDRCGVSAPTGTLPYRPFPRLVMLWMYADCVRDPRERQDPVSSLCDFLIALGIEWMDIAPLFEQANRLFACRFRMGNRVIPVIDASVLRRARAAVRVPDVPSLDGMQVAYSATFRQEMAERHFQPCMHTLRALRHCPFALDVSLWGACYAARPPQGASPVACRAARSFGASMSCRDSPKRS